MNVKESLKYGFGVASGVLATGLLVSNIALAAGPICNVPADYATIQGAVNDVTCTTVNVAAGTYAEHVAVNRSLILNGANVGVAGNGLRGPESVITGTTTGSIQITANNITVDGFEVMSAANDLGSGIHMSATNSGYSIKNNLITGNQIGIYANSNGTSSIDHNLFDGNNSPGSAAGSGIYSEFTDHMTISNNEFKNHTTNNPIIFGATGPAVHKDLVVSNNNIHDNISGIYTLAVSNGLFTGNTISATDATGISFSGGDQGVTVTSNTISNSARGIRIEDAGYLLGANTGIVINRNSFTGNSEYGVGNITASTTLVDATCNWWGSASGPGPVGPGSGDKVSTNVTFSPWLTTSDLGSGPCNGPIPPPPVPTTKAQCMDNGWKTLQDSSGKNFKNQGDCVSFVATKGKNKAAGN